MPMAAMSSADEPKMISRSILKCCPEVVRTTICIHGADVCDGQASAGFAQSDGDGGDERVRLHAAADIHQSGVIRELNAVTLSGICATGMYRVGNGSRLRAPSRMPPAMPII